MNLQPVAALLAALTLTAGLAYAQPAGGERDDSFEVFDLTSVGGGGIIYIMCQNWKEGPDSITECKRPSIWLESNELNRLQSTTHTTGGKAFEPDMSLLP